MRRGREGKGRKGKEREGKEREGEGRGGKEREGKGRGGGGGCCIDWYRFVFGVNGRGLKCDLGCVCLGSGRGFRSSRTLGKATAL